VAKVSDIVAASQSLWPIELADEWDQPGLVSGLYSAPVTKVLLAVDLTIELMNDAIAGGFDMVITHHPFLLKVPYELSKDSGKGAVLAAAIRGDVALFSAHTNADVVETGVSHALAGALGLLNAKPLVPTVSAEVGHGRIGDLGQPVTLLEFSRMIARNLSATAGGVRVAGSAEATISRVALCGGAGDAFLQAALDSSADVYVTSDLRHHPVQDALEQSKASSRQFSLVDISHWAAESLWLSVAAKQLADLVSDVKFVVSDLRTDPWDFAVTQ
jgi:dinuclear metal center YbgI/SA1388 family protein